MMLVYSFAGKPHLEKGGGEEGTGNGFQWTIANRLILCSIAAYQEKALVILPDTVLAMVAEMGSKEETAREDAGRRRGLEGWLFC